MKRLLVILLALVMVMSFSVVLTGCDNGGQTDPDGPGGVLGPNITIGEMVNYEDDFEDEFGNTIHYVYQVPQVFGSESAYVMRINEDMEKLVYGDIGDAMDAMNHGTYPGLCKVETFYTFAEPYGIHSLMLKFSFDWEGNEYICYNFDEQGNEITNSELIEMCGYSEAEVQYGAYSQAAECVDYEDLLLENPDFVDMADGFQDVKEKTLNLDNISLMNDMYIDENYNPHMITWVYSMAGADRYKHDFCILDGLDKEIKPDDCALRGPWIAELPQGNGEPMWAKLYFFTDGTGGYEFGPLEDSEGNPLEEGEVILEHYDYIWTRIPPGGIGPYEEGLIVLEANRAGGEWAMDGKEKTFLGGFRIKIKQGNINEMYVQPVEGDNLPQDPTGSTLSFSRILDARG